MCACRLANYFASELIISDFNICNTIYRVQENYNYTVLILTVTCFLDKNKNVEIN